VNIQKLFPSHVYRRGLDYYKRYRVSNLVYDVNHHVWTALVQGSEPYFVELGLKKLESGTIEMYCDCPAFHTYGTCKHVAATLFAIKEKELQDVEDDTHKFNYRAANHFINSVSSIKQEDPVLEILSEKDPLHIEYHCKWSYERKLLIELKAGVNRCYVVKDAEEFLESVLEEKEYFFTKNFTYSPESHYISQQDRSIFELLFSAFRNEEIYQDYTFYPQRKNVNERRFIVIPPLIVHELLGKLVERDFIVEADNRTYQKPILVEDGSPFTFEITFDKQGHLLLNISGADEVVYFEHYHLLFHEGAFYFPGKDQHPILKQITLLKDHQQLPIEKNQADTFLSDVLPSLKQVGEVEIDPQVKSRIIDVPLHAKLYLELSEEFLIGNLEYHYGNEEIDPFSGRMQYDQLISRNTAKERQIMGLIEYANFHYNGKELYIKVDDEALYHFIYDILPLLDKYVDLYLTEDIQNLIVEHDLSPSTNIQVESSSNLLDIGFDIEGVDKDEVTHIINAVIERNRFYRLNSGEIMSLENEEFSSIQQMLDDLDVDRQDIHDGSVKMPVYRGMQIDELIETRKKYDPSFEKLLNHLKSPEEQHYDLPKNLNATLRSYQETGFQWYKSLSDYHLGGILADDMGLGKTLQSIAYILSEPSDLPHLVVVPSSVVYNWKNEFEKFAPDLSVAIMRGTPPERSQKIKDSGEIDVWITSYATLRQDIDQYAELKFQTMILDEAQFIKNY